MLVRCVLFKRPLCQDFFDIFRTYIINLQGSLPKNYDSLNLHPVICLKLLFHFEVIGIAGFVSTCSSEQMHILYTNMQQTGRNSIVTPENI